MYVLIIAIYLANQNGGVGVASVEFTSEATCKEAGAAMAKEWRRNSMSVLDLIRFVCVKK